MILLVVEPFGERDDTASKKINKCSDELPLHLFYAEKAGSIHKAKG